MLLVHEKVYDKSCVIKFFVVIIISMMLLCPYFVFIDTFLSLSMWACFSILVFASGQARSKLGGVDTSILHHVFLLLFTNFLRIIMLYGVIIVPFSLIICKVHTKRENSDSWKSRPGKAMSRHLFCTTSNKMKFYGDFLWNV